MNGSGSPVGGIEPVMTCYCTEAFNKRIAFLQKILYNEFGEKNEDFYLWR